MPYIPIIIPLEEDEILYSYIMRLAEANAFQDIRGLLAAYAWTNEDVLDKRAKRIKRDSFNYLGQFYEALNPPLSVDELFLKTTLYTGISPFINRAQQTNIVNLVFRRNARDILVNTYDWIKNLKCCPMCMEEEKQKKGYFYFHREHQMPAVVSCYKHQCALKVCKNSFGTEIKQPNLVDISEDTNEVTIGYAKYVKDILEANLSVDKETIKITICEWMTNHGYTLDEYGYNQLGRDINQTENGNLFTDDIGLYLKNQMPSSKAENCAMLILLTYIMFGSVSVLKQYLSVSNEIELTFYNNISGYDAYVPYRNNIIEMSHRQCKHHFFTTPDGFVKGWRCPRCEEKISSKEIVESLLKISTNGRYSLIDVVYNTRREVSSLLVRHNECNKKYCTTMAKFFERGARCECEHRVPFSRIKKEIESYPDFKLINYINVNEAIKIKHKGCGKTFDVGYYDFVKRPYCRVCLDNRIGTQRKTSNIKPIRTKESFQHEIWDLVGEEYKLVGEFINGKTPVEIYHNKCEKITLIKPNAFAQGIRCKYCNIKKTDYESFQKIVYEISYGRYQIIASDRKPYYNIQDNKTGNQYWMLKSVILQELHRHTPSLILPMDKKCDVDQEIIRNKTITERLYEWICENYKCDDFISPAEILLPWVRNDKSAFLLKYVKQGLLKKVQTGLYCFPEKDNISTDEIIKYMYINHNGDQIGYLYGESFAYSLGIISHKPEKIYITTNRFETNNLDRMVVPINGEKVVLRKAFCSIDKSNYKVFSIIDYLVRYPNYRRKYKGEKIKGEYTMLHRYLEESNIVEEDFIAYVQGFDEQDKLLNEIHKIYEEKK